MSGLRVRRRVEDDAAKEEPWTLAAYEWDPVSCVAYKKRNLGPGPGGEGPSCALEVVPASSLDSELGLHGDDTCGMNATSLQQQIANGANPQLGSLPVLDTSDRADAEPATVCEVVGCGASLEGLKRYYVRMRVCELHLHAPALLINGVVSRFCQQCARFHFVGEFSGNKKSCIATLERHNARHRAKVLARLQEQLDAESDGKSSKVRARKKAPAAKRRAAQTHPRTGPTAAVPVTPAEGQAIPASPDTSGGDGTLGDGFGHGMPGIVFPPVAATGSPVTHPGGGGGAQSSLEAEAAPSANSPHPPALGWDGATSGWAALPPRPLVTTGGNAIVSMDDRGPSQTPSTGVSQAAALHPSALPQQQQPAAPPPSLPLWPAGTATGWESHTAFGNAAGGAPPLPSAPYDVRCALGALQEQIKAPPPSVDGPATGFMYSSKYGSAASMAQLTTPAFVSDAGDGVITRSGSVPSPRSAKSGPRVAAMGGDVALAAGGDVSNSTQVGGSASGTTGSVSQATARQALTAHHHSNLAAAAGSSGLNEAGSCGATPEPCGSSGGGALAAASPACSLTEGVSATRVSGSGVSDIHDGPPGDVAARITRIFQELGPLLEQYRQQTTSGSGSGSGSDMMIVPTHSAFAASQDLPSITADTGLQGGAPNGGAPNGGPLQSSASAGATAPTAGGQDRVGSSSLPPMSDAVLAMMSHASQLNAGLQPGVVPPWTVTSGAPQASPFPPFGAPNTDGYPLGTGNPVAGAAAASVAPGSGPGPGRYPPQYRNATPAHLLAPGPMPQPAMAIMAPAPPPQPVPAFGGTAAAGAVPGWRQLTSHPGVMVNAAVVGKPPAPALPSQQQLPGAAPTASAAATVHQPHPPLHPMSMAPTTALLSSSGSGGQSGAMVPMSGGPLATAHAGMYPPHTTTTTQPQSPAGTPGSSLSALPHHESPSCGEVHPPAFPQYTGTAAAGRPVLATGGSGPVCAAPVAAPTPARVPTQQYATAPSASATLGADLSGLEVDDELMELLSCLDEPESRDEKEWEAAYQHVQHNAANMAHQVVVTHQRYVQTVQYGEHMGAFPWQHHPHPYGPPPQPLPPPPQSAAMYVGSSPFTAGPAQYGGGQGYVQGPQQSNWVAFPTVPGVVPAPGVCVRHGVGAGFSAGPVPAGAMAPVAIPGVGVGVIHHEELDDVDPRELTRVSLKAMNVLPHELPPNIRSNLRRWLREARVEALQATLRPGCLQLVVDVRRQDPSAPVDLASALIPAHDPEEAAVDVFRIMGQRLRDTYVQVDRSVLQIRVGERPVVLSWEQAAEDGGLDGAKYPTLAGCDVVAVCAGSDAALQVSGSFLAQPYLKVFARLRGHDLTAVLLPSAPPPPSTDTSAASSGTTSHGGGGGGGDKDRVRMSVRVPPGAVGLMVVEVGVGHLLGGWCQVMVLPRGRVGAADELRRLRQQEQEVAGSGGQGKRQRSGGFWRLMGDLSVVLEVLSDATAAADADAGTAPTLGPAAGSPTATGSPNSVATPRFPSPDAVGASTVSASDAGTTTASAAGWSYGGRTDTLSGAGSSLASFATAASSGRLAPVVPQAVPARTPCQAVYTPHQGPPAAAAAAAANGSSRHSGTPLVVPAPPPTAALQRALARACRLLRFTVTRGLPHLTAMLLPAALRLARFAADSGLRTAAPVHHQHSTAAAALQPPPAAHGGAPAAGPSSTTTARGLLVAAGVDPQALLPLAVLSGSTATVDVLSKFAAGELAAPLQMDVPQGSAGLSPLHLAALLDDGGAISRHLLATQPWAAWGWVSLGWTPPEAAAAASYRREATVADGDGKEKQGEEEEEDEEEEVVPEPVRLTPGSLCVLLGRRELVRQAVGMLVAPVAPRVGNAGVSSQGAEGAAMIGSLVGAVEAWGRTGCALLSILCEQLARQRL